MIIPEEKAELLRLSILVTDALELADRLGLTDAGIGLDRARLAIERCGFMCERLSGNSN